MISTGLVYVKGELINITRAYVDILMVIDPVGYVLGATGHKVFSVPLRFLCGVRSTILAPNDKTPV